MYKLMVECIIDVLVANGLFYDILCRSKSQAKSLSRCQLPPNMMSFRQMKKDPLKIYCKGTKEFFLRHMRGSCNIRRVEIGVEFWNLCFLFNFQLKKKSGIKKVKFTLLELGCRTSSV